MAAARRSQATLAVLVTGSGLPGKERQVTITCSLIERQGETGQKKRTKMQSLTFSLLYFDNTPSNPFGKNGQKGFITLKITDILTYVTL